MRMNKTFHFLAQHRRELRTIEGGARATTAQRARRLIRPIIKGARLLTLYSVDGEGNVRHYACR